MSGERSRREAEDLQHQAEHIRPRRKMSVFGYMAGLFSVAVLLLLIAFFQQQRANDEAADALQKSQSTIESIQQLLDENKLLRAENEALKSEKEELQGQVTQLDSDRRTQNLNMEALLEEMAGQENALKAMDFFWQIDEAFALNRYNLCRTLIQEMGDLSQYLPNWKATENNRFSPAKRFEEIKQALG